MSAIEVKLEVFEGPLDLLLHLIDKNKVNIYDIPIAIITDQYLDYVAAMEKEDLNVVSEFLVMAAMLLAIKSKMLLPKEEKESEEDEGDPRAELVQKLLEYKMYKYVSMELRDMQMDADRALYKKSTVPDEAADYKLPVDTEELMDGVTLAGLQAIFNDVMKRVEEKVDPIRSKFGKIEKEVVSYEEKAAHINEYIKYHRSFSFRDLLERSNSKTEVIVTFLVILEMIKDGRLSVTQESREDEIMITSLEDENV